MKALSSTTRTVRFAGSRMLLAGAASEDTIALLERADLDTPVVEMEVDAPAVIAADVLGADVDPAGGQEVREHARAAGELGADAFDIGTEPGHLGKQERHRRRRELRRVRAIARHRLVGEQDVRETADARRAVIERDRHARPEPDRDERLLITADGTLR